MPGGVLEELDVDVNACIVGGNVGTTGGGRVSGARLPGVLELVVVLELLDESGPSGEVVLVVELVPEIVVVAPGKVVVVPPMVVVVAPGKVVVVPLMVVVVELLVADVVDDGRTVVVVELLVDDVVEDGRTVVVVELLVDDVVDDGRTVVVVELLVDDVVDDGRTVVVVPRMVVDVDDDVLELLLVDASPTVVELVPLGQPPLGAGIMSSLWPPWPLRLLASTVIVT